MGIKMYLKSTGAISTIFLLISCSSSIACSLRAGTVLPSNYELVQQARAIVVALAEDADSNTGRGAISFRVEHVLKGSLSIDDEVELEGHLEFRGASEIGDFSKARRGAYGGRCRAQDYRLGYRYLLFLDSTDTEWRLLGVAFSRINEEISGLGDPWVKAVAHYVRISALSHPQLETEALTALRDGTASQVAGLAADIDTWFAHPSPRKRVEENLALLDRVDSQYQREQVLWVLVGQGGPLVDSLVQSLVDSHEWVTTAGPVSRHIVKTGNHGRLWDLVRHYQAVDNRWALLSAIVKLARAGDQNLLLPLLEVADESELERLAKWFVVYPDSRATDYLVEIVDGKYPSKWQLAIQLASMGDRAVLDWAIDKANHGPRLWLTDYILAASPLTEAEPYIREILESGDRSRQMNLVDAQVESAIPNVPLINRAFEAFQGDSPCLSVLRGRIQRLTSRSVAGSDSLLKRVEAEIGDYQLDGKVSCF